MTEGTMTADVEVQYVVDSVGLPREEQLREWAVAALPEHLAGAELVIRVVDEEESRELNSRYRGKDRPTNVLSFPFEAPPDVDSRHLGDLVICAPVVEREALEQGKEPAHHWAHMVAHGVLHLAGMKHDTAQEAGQMEDRERQVLARFGIGDPYGED